MSAEQRKHVRLTLDIPAFRYTEIGEKVEMMVYQISIGGCLIEWDENIKIDDEFRLEIQLPNKNWLPLHCDVLYLIKGDGIGLQFQEITMFEQELIADIMSKTLEESGVSSTIDPFAQPKTLFFARSQNEEVTLDLEEKDIVSVE